MALKKRNALALIAVEILAIFLGEIATNCFALSDSGAGLAPKKRGYFKIIGKTNWVFTLIPRFIAGSTAGKSLSLDCKTLSTVTMS